MQISNNNSPSFGSIQVRLSRMNRHQTGLSDRLFDTIKYAEKYQKLSGEDLDIYMLPAKSSKEIEIRFMDPYSGMFVRNEKGKIIKETLRSGMAEKIEGVADKVMETYKKIVDSVIPRPKEDLYKVISGKTEMATMNPTKYDDFFNDINNWKRLGMSQEDAEELAFNQFKGLYHIDNMDANI